MQDALFFDTVAKRKSLFIAILELLHVEYSIYYELTIYSIWSILRFKHYLNFMNICYIFLQIVSSSNTLSLHHFNNQSNYILHWVNLVLLFILFWIFCQKRREIYGTRNFRISFVFFMNIKVHWDCKYVCLRFKEFLTEKIQPSADFT